MVAIVGREVKRGPGGGQVGDIAANASWVDVCNQLGSGCGAVAFPEFVAVVAIVGREVKCGTNHGQVTEALKTLDELGASGCGAILIKINSTHGVGSIIKNRRAWPRR